MLKVYVLCIVSVVVAAGNTNNNAPRSLGVEPSTCQERGGTIRNDESCEICTSPNNCCTIGRDGTKECYACSSADQAETQICSLWTCTPNDQNDDLMTCSGCGSFFNGIDFDKKMICFDYTCETTNEDDDTGDCACNQVTYLGNNCGACSRVDGKLIFDCSSLGGPLYAASPTSTVDQIDTVEEPTSTTVAPTDTVEEPTSTTVAPTETPIALTSNPTISPSAMVTPADATDTVEELISTVAPTETPIVLTANPTESPSAMVTPAPTLAPTRAPVRIVTRPPSLETVEENDDSSKIPMDSEQAGEDGAPLLFQPSSASTCLTQGILSILSVYMLLLWMT